MFKKEKCKNEPINDATDSSGFRGRHDKKNVLLGEENGKKWLKQLEDGDDDAYQFLFVTFYGTLGMFALKYVDRQEIAEDLVQDVLYELWLKKLHFENVLSLKSYLYNMVRNRCLDILKHRKVEEKYWTEQQLNDGSEFFLHQIIEEEVYTLLKEAVNTLPEQTSKVFQLILDGHDNAEIAAIMNLSLDAIKSHKKRGKKIMQDKLKGLLYLFWLIRCEDEE